MGVSQGEQLSEIIRGKLEELKEVCGGVDESTAAQAPSGRWSPKEILSHLLGVEGVGLGPVIQLVLEQDTPRLDLEPGEPFYTEGRRKTAFADLLARVTTEYTRIADMVAGLSNEELARFAHVPMFKETPMGEYPTLGVFIRAMTEHHLDFHITHMKEVLKALKGD